MSIKVGFLNNRYELQSLNNQDDILTLNSFANSNIIQLNTENNSTNDIFIKYKDSITTGITSNTYVIDDIKSNSRLISANTANIQINKPLLANSTFAVKNMIAASNNNISFNLEPLNGLFAVSSSTRTAASNIFKLNANKTVEMSSDNFSIQNSNQTRTLMQVTPSQTNINQNVYINDGTLYVNAISPIGNRKLEMYNVTYSQSIIDSFLATKKMSIIQAPTEGDTLPFEICKKYVSNGSANVFHAYSCNIISGKAPRIHHNLIVNRDGLVGLGTNTPDATLSIRTLNNNIISYIGDTYGDLFKLTKNADIGIGTATPKAQVHIRRNDDEVNDSIRRNPMLYLDMNYDANNNYSNLYDPQNSTLTDDLRIVSKPIATTYVSGNSFNIELTNNFYMINNTIYSIMGNSPENISNIQLYNSDTLELSVPTTQPSMGTMYFLMTNQLIYPAADVIYIEEDSTLRTQNTFIENNQTVYQVNYVLFMMSQTTKINQGGYNNSFTTGYYNASNFTNYETNATTNKFNNIVYSVNNYNIRVKIDFIFEKNLFNPFNQTTVVSYPITYSKITRTLLPPPQFMQVTYNNNFVSEINTDGTLCLGSQVPAALKNKNYKVYTPTGGICAQHLNISAIDTDHIDSNISFSGKNLANVNKLICKELDVASLVANNIDFDSVSGSFIDMDIGHYDHIYTSNISFQTINNDYMTMNSNNVLFKNRVHCGSILTGGSDAYLRIAVDSNITNVTTTANLFNTRSGIVVTTDDNINPAITVQTLNTNTSPYFRLNNSETSYYLRVKKSVGSDSTSTTMLQIANDNITDERAAYFVNNNISPHIIQHIKEYNLLTFGEQNTICIDTLDKESQSLTNTNKSSKISVGIPYASIAQQYAVKDYPKYFTQNINVDTNPYMLNIFGNVAVANIANNPMITAITGQNDNKVYIGINCHPDNIHTLRVLGDISTSNIYLDELLALAPDNTSLITYLSSLNNRLRAIELALSLTQ